MADVWRLSSDGYLIYNNKRLSFTEVLKQGNGLITTINNEPVGLLVERALDALKVGGVPADEMVTVDNISVLLPVTADPILSFPANINEGDTVTMTIDNYDPEDIYFFTVEKGSLGTLDKVNGTIEYTGYDITDGLNGVDTISVYATSVGKVRSHEVSYELNILYVEIVADQALINSDFTTNGSYSENFEY